jgi:recombination protein RecR
MAAALANLHSGVKTCPVTFALIDPDQDVSPLYSDPARDRRVVAVVEEPLDIVALERTAQFHGTYHVLGGAISPIDGIGPEQLHIPELIERIKKDEVEEIIIATNASVEGESTALFLQRYINDAGISVKMTRLARGIPVGVDLEYADQITLTHALEGRRVL